MHLLILGCSSIVRRRVLPAAARVPAITRVSVASRTQVPLEGAEIAWFADYDEALSRSGADMVYVSGTNDTHQRWVTRALERGLHVVVDKPALPTGEAARAAVALARQRRCALAEATVFPYHPLFAAVRERTAGEDHGRTRVFLSFSFPPLPPSDFRYRAACLGGALYDVGPYVVATNRLLFGRPPARVECAVQSREQDVDTSFTFLLSHEHGGAIAGHCGFVTAYSNRLTVLTTTKSIQADRVFSPPADHVGNVVVRDDTGEKIVEVAAADSFARFLAAFVDGAAAGQTDAFASALLDDAALLERLREAAR